MTEHEFQQTIFGKDADDVQAKAEEAVRAYFGTALEAEGVKWAVDSEGKLNMAGKVVTYEGRVRAWRV